MKRTRGEWIVRTKRANVGRRMTLFTERTRFFALFVALSTPACKAKPPEGTAHPPGEANAPNPDASGDPEAPTAEEPAPAPKECPAQVADAPSELFMGRVLIRPPVGVEIVDDAYNPSLATTQSRFTSACDAVVEQMGIQIYENDAKKTLETYLNEAVEGLSGGGQWGPGTIETTYKSDDKNIHAKVVFAQKKYATYMVFARRFDWVFFVLYVTSPAEFDVLKPTFEASAGRLIVSPPEP